MEYKYWEFSFWTYESKCKQKWVKMNKHDFLLLPPHSPLQKTKQNKKLYMENVMEEIVWTPDT